MVSQLERPCQRVTRWKLKLAEYAFDIAYKAGKTNVNADALSWNPTDLEDIENVDINNKNRIEINLIKQGNAKRTSNFEYKNKVSKTNLTCNEEINYDIIEKSKIDPSNCKETKELMNGENFTKNKNNRRNYDELKYKVIEDGNIGNDNFKGNEETLINDGNSIKNMKDKEENDDINNKDFEKRKICKNFEEIKQYERTLLKNVDTAKRYYGDFNEDKIDGSDTEEIEHSLKEEYLLKNDNDNHEKCCMN